MAARASVMMAPADFDLTGDVEADALPDVPAPSVIKTANDNVMTSAARRGEP
jgi:hypothetical protein